MAGKVRWYGGGVASTVAGRTVEWSRVTFWITERAREWVEAAEVEGGNSTDAVWASQLLSDDLLRWSRWWLGLGTFLVALVAAVAAGSLGMTLAIDPPGTRVPSS